MVNKLDLYRIFIIVGQHESFSKAAKHLYMTQSAVSQAMKQLEKELDTRLFTRNQKGVSLTDEGALLFDYVYSAINLIRTGEEIILEFKNLTAGELKIGVGDTISKYFLLSYLETFHNNYPKIRFKLVNGTTTEVTALLKSGDVDVIVCNFPLKDPTLEQLPCMEIQDIFVCGEVYKQKIKEPLAMKALNELPLIFLEPNSNSRHYVEDFLLSKGIKLEPEFELGSYDLLLEFAKINLGIACVTREFSKEYLQKGIVHEIQMKDQIPPRNVGVAYLKSVPLSPASKKFVEVIQEGQNESC
jgi:LysR family transcriptional regulator, transcriptional activator of the cysJI operon